MKFKFETLCLLLALSHHSAQATEFNWSASSGFLPSQVVPAFTLVDTYVFTGHPIPSQERLLVSSVLA